VLDTPFETCVERIHQRRVERGRNVGAKLNLKSQESNYRAIHRYAERAVGAGIRVSMINDEVAYDQVHDLLRSGRWDCGHTDPARWTFPLADAS
jgi:thymidylate kinase